MSLMTDRTCCFLFLHKWNSKKCQVHAKIRPYCVWVKRKTLCNCLCSSSCDCQPCPEYHSQPFRDFGPCHKVKSPVCCDSLISSENGFGYFKEQHNRQAKVVLRKKLFVILCNAVRKLKKLLILPLLINNYPSLYSINLLYLSIYFTILLVAGLSYQRVPCLTEGCS